MKALQFTAQDQPEVLELATPEIARDEVLIAARRVGVCHSDIDLLEGRYIIPFSYPIIPGHEWSGQVAALGSDVTGFTVGDTVVGECVIGDDHFGFSISGAGAEYFVAKPAWLHKVPSGLSFADAALVEPFSVAYSALMKVGNVNASDILVVLGAGPIGLAVTAGAAALGAVTVVVEPSEDRRVAATKLGAAHTVHPDAAAEFIADLSNGRGANVVIECSGRPEVMALALEYVANRGRVCYVGIDVGRSAPAKLGLIQSKELAITGVIGSEGLWPATLRFLANTKIDLSPLITNVFAAADALQALESAHSPQTTIKAHIEFDAPLLGDPVPR
ncbi:MULTISPECIES: zinc-dependent alcohol dehydrogenase [Subtercola]|uniref:Alcohol dehydrogenase n=1 Tax=Subtercola vilae TaxID=2056433 RepID=A0A4T2C4L2_9MICO|nr:MULTISPECIES: zinc-binding dehydrogenase [Subtercola]MEA9984136.1 zinc-binding dehydrogenase [Subtercola sp. RTI3]TIH38649.1 alcohol dehydrogenase [Subtercola vilae]